MFMMDMVEAFGYVVAGRQATTSQVRTVAEIITRLTMLSGWIAVEASELRKLAE